MSVLLLLSLVAMIASSAMAGKTQPKPDPTPISRPDVDPTPRPRPVTPPFDWHGVLSDLLSMKAKFLTHQMKNYEYTRDESCFCISCQVEPRLITVVDGKVTGTIFTAKNTECRERDLISPEDTRYTLASWFDDAIAYVEQEIANGCAEADWESNNKCWEYSSLEVTFDRKFHFITMLVYDHAAMAFDGGRSIAFRCMGGDCTNEPTTTTTTTTTTDTPTPPFDWIGVKAELLEMKEQFQSHNIDDYTFTYQRGMCFCTTCSMVARIITVEGTEVAHAEMASNNDGCGDSHLVPPFDTRYTLKSWFDFAMLYIEKQIRNGCADDDWYANSLCHPEYSLELEYDPQFSYITRYLQDEAAMAHDGGLLFDFECIDGDCAPSQPCICTMEYDPYCCGDNEYGNLCQAQCNGERQRDCTRGVCATEPEPEDCMCTREIYGICCGTRNIVDNLCAMACNGESVSDCTRGACEPEPEEPEDDCMCEKKHDPHCCDGESYNNLCLGTCDGHRERDCTVGKCEDEDSDCGCKPKEYDLPVCCDDQLFDSMCDAECAGYNDRKCEEDNGRCGKMSRSFIFSFPSDASFAVQISEWWVHAHPQLVWFVVFCGLGSIIAAVVCAVRMASKALTNRKHCHNKAAKRQQYEQVGNSADFTSESSDTGLSSF